MLRKLKSNYNKNIIIVSDNISYFLDTLDEYIIFNNGKVVVTGDKKDLYNEDLSNYLDINELIKGIYRSVEGK